MGAMPRFLCDAMLGSLARWLRLMGFDTAYEAGGEDGELARRAAEEGRWLLTRDRGLAAAGPRTVWIRAEALEDQLVEVFERLGLEPDPGCFGSRCAACNGVVRPVAREAVEGKVPPFVLATVDGFRICEGCGRVYWRGSHVARIGERIGRVLDRLEAHRVPG